MSFFFLLQVETGRQLRSRISWLILALTLLSPMAGYTLYHPAPGDSMASLYLANPMIAGGLAGCILFAVWMAVSLDGPGRSGVTSLTNSMVPSLTVNTVRLTAILLLAILLMLAAGVIYLPYTAFRLDIVFSWNGYWLAVWLIFFSGPVMGALFSCIMYQISERLDLCLAAVLAFLIISRSIRGGEFLWQWSVPLVPALSDAFGNALVWRTAVYSRLVWLCLLGGGWAISCLCVRQYGRGAAGSFLWQLRRCPWKLLPAIFLVAGGCWLWHWQPYVDHSPDNWMETEMPSLSNEELTLLQTDLQINIDSYLIGSLSGTAVYHLQNHSGQSQELYMKLNPGYQIRSLTVNGVSEPWTDLKNDYIATREIRCSLPADPEILLEIHYGGSPRIWNEREYLMSGSLICRRSLEVSSSHLAPALGNCVMIDENAKAHMQMSLPEDMTMVTTGFTQKMQENEDGTCEWTADAVGTDRFQVFAGDYVKLDLENGDMPIEFYYSKKYQERLEGMGAVDMIEQVVRYCTEHYGPRSFSAEEPFKIVQTTVFSFGGFAVNNISGMGETYFSDQNLKDTEKGAASAEVLAHEIVHQWWGLGATLMDPDDDEWSDEGITTYTTYRIMCGLKGKEYAMENYVDKWKEEVEDNKKNFYLRHPEYLDRLPDAYANDIRARTRAVNWYSGTALMIYRASEILGETAVDQIWAELYRKSEEQEQPYITKKDFLEACGLSGEEIGYE